MWFAWQCTVCALTQSLKHTHTHTRTEDTHHTHVPTHTTPPPRPTCLLVQEQYIYLEGKGVQEGALQDVQVVAGTEGLFFARWQGNPMIPATLLLAWGKFPGYNCTHKHIRTGQSVTKWKRTNTLSLPQDGRTAKSQGGGGGPQPVRMPWQVLRQLTQGRGPRGEEGGGHCPPTAHQGAACRVNFAAVAGPAQRQ